MKNRKRVLPMILVLVLTLTVIPTAALAAEDSIWDFTKDALKDGTKEIIQDAIQSGLQYIKDDLFGSSENEPVSKPAEEPPSPFVFDVNGVLTEYRGSDGKVFIPDGVVEIGEFAFYGNANLNKVTISDSVSVIDKGAFAYSGLNEISLPNSVTYIGASAFEGCSDLTVANFGGGITSIDSGAFYGCSALTYVLIPNNVTFIGDKAFADCVNLKEVILPKGCQVAENAFQNTPYQAEVDAKIAQRNTTIAVVTVFVVAAAAAVLLVLKKKRRTNTEVATVEASPVDNDVPADDCAPGSEKPPVDGVFCPNCGKPVTPGTNLCPGCGQSMSKTE